MITAVITDGAAGSRLLFADLLDEEFEPHDVNRVYIHGSEKPEN